MDAQLNLLAAAAAESPSEEHVVQLLDYWSLLWKHRGRSRAIGPGAYEKYCTLGLFGHGGITGISKACGQREACAAINAFLKDRFPNRTWTSIAVLYNPKIGLHRDVCNLAGHLNHAITLGTFTGGKVWIEDDEGTSSATLIQKNGTRSLCGTWKDVHNEGLSFDARRYHQIEPHEGRMWALAAYTPQAFLRMTNEQASDLLSLNFPLPANTTQANPHDAHPPLRRCSSAGRLMAH